MPLYKKGDLVKHTNKFLRDTGWYTDVPKDGRVFEDQEEGDSMVRVQWCDSDHDVGIQTTNIMPHNKPDYS